MPAVPLSILVVDDYADAADALAHLLTIAGYEGRAVHSAAAAERAAAEQPPDVVVIEVRLMCGCGYALPERITRAAGREPVFVALSTAPDPGGRSKAAGFSAHFVKLDDDHRLLALIRKLAAKRTP